MLQVDNLHRQAPTNIRLYSPPGVSRNSFQLAQNHINQGINLIVDGNYEEAIGLFFDAKFADDIGYTLKLKAIHPLPLPQNKDDLLEAIEIVAYESGVNKNKVIILQRLRVDPNWLLECGLLNFVQKELALLYAEEWIHVLEELANGQPISTHSLQIFSYGNHTGYYPKEIEVADYFLDNGLTLNFLNSTQWLKRYDRKKVLTEILGN